MLIIILAIAMMMAVPLGCVWIAEATRNPAWYIGTITSFIVMLCVMLSLLDTHKELEIYQDLGKQGWSVQTITYISGSSTARIVTDNGWIDYTLDRLNDKWVITDIDDCDKVKPVKRDKIATPEDLNS